MEKKEENLIDVIKTRDSIIIKTSIIGIVTNVMLALFKAEVGIITNSIAIVLDAVNNLSDAVSSVITIVGTKLAGKQPDKKHPMGHGRVEYLSSLIVAAIILYAGITSLIESVKKIINPEKAEYTTVSLIIMVVAIVVKLILGRYVKKQGERVNSGALTASGADASFDAVLTASVLASALLDMLFHISLEAYVGVLIAIIIIKAGLEMIGETLDEILGVRVDAEVSAGVKTIINEEPEVMGAYDLMIYNYGPNKNYGSVHIELPDTMTVEEVDKLTRRIEYQVYQQTGIILTGVGVYSYNTCDGVAKELREAIQKQISTYEWAIQMHGFYVDLEEKNIRFDVVASFDIERKKASEIIYKDVKEMFPEYDIQIIIDIDVTD